MDSFPEMDDGSIILSYKEVVYQADERYRITVILKGGMQIPGGYSLFQKRSDPFGMR